MQKNTLLAVVLSSAVLIIYYGFIYKAPKPPASAPSTVSASPTPGTQPSPGASPETQSAQPAPPPVASAPKAPVVQTDVQTSLVKAHFSSQTGLVQNWWLEKFYEQADKKGPHIDLLHGSEAAPAMGLLLGGGQGLVEPYYVLTEEGEASLHYSGESGGLKIEEIVEYGKTYYSLGVTLKISNPTAGPIEVSPGLRLATPQKDVPKKKGFLKFGKPPELLHPVFRDVKKVRRKQKVDELGAYQEQRGQISWAGLEDRYFLRAVIARSLSAENKVGYGRQDNRVFADLQYPPSPIAPGDQKEFQFSVYLGPKDPTYLKEFAGAGLDQAIDLGWFAIVARPILYSLKFFHSFLGNWGLAIIFLTIIIKLLLHPLTKKSMQSMKGMQQLQPQLKALREKYKDDKEKLNVETMNLFRQHKVNPMGGCLPMIIQMPIYIALYKVLYNATELYHAPFFWFYRDLSAPDPYYVLPILLGIFMVLQQKMTPTTGDSTQTKMMMIMPVLFTVFMLFLPVGLVLYIFVNTVMTVVQQYMHTHDKTIIGMLKGKKA